VFLTILNLGRFAYILESVKRFERSEAVERWNDWNWLREIEKGSGVLSYKSRCQQFCSPVQETE